MITKAIKKMDESHYKQQKITLTDIKVNIII